MNNHQYFSVQIQCRIMETDKDGNWIGGGSGQLELNQSIKLRPGMAARELFRVLEKVYAFGEDLKQGQQ